VVSSAFGRLHIVSSNAFRMAIRDYVKPSPWSCTVDARKTAGINESDGEAALAGKRHVTPCPYNGITALCCRDALGLVVLFLEGD
jgi:hypothetical protein